MDSNQHTSDSGYSSNVSASRKRARNAPSEEDHPSKKRKSRDPSPAAPQSPQIQEKEEEEEEEVQEQEPVWDPVYPAFRMLDHREQLLQPGILVVDPHAYTDRGYRYFRREERQRAREAEEKARQKAKEEAKDWAAKWARGEAIEIPEEEEDEEDDEWFQQPKAIAEAPAYDDYEGGITREDMQNLLKSWSWKIAFSNPAQQQDEEIDPLEED